MKKKAVHIFGTASYFRKSEINARPDTCSASTFEPSK